MEDIFRATSHNEEVLAKKQSRLISLAKASGLAVTAAGVNLLINALLG